MKTRTMQLCSVIVFASFLTFAASQNDSSIAPTTQSGTTHPRDVTTHPSTTAQQTTHGAVTTLSPEEGNFNLKVGLT